jgi:hypothetical protein
MEEVATAERQKPARPYDDLPALPEALKQQLSSLLSSAAKLERDYQSVLCRRLGAQLMVSAAQPASCAMASRCDTLQSGDPGRQPAAAIA